MPDDGIATVSRTTEADQESKQASKHMCVCEQKRYPSFFVQLISFLSSSLLYSQLNHMRPPPCHPQAQPFPREAEEVFFFVAAAAAHVHTQTHALNRHLAVFFFSSLPPRSLSFTFTLTRGFECFDFVCLSHSLKRRENGMLFMYTPQNTRTRSKREGG